MLLNRARTSLLPRPRSRFRSRARPRTRAGVRSRAAASESVTVPGRGRDDQSQRGEFSQPSFFFHISTLRRATFVSDRRRVMLFAEFRIPEHGVSAVAIGMLPTSRVRRSPSSTLARQRSTRSCPSGVLGEGRRCSDPAGRALCDSRPPRSREIHAGHRHHDTVAAARAEQPSPPTTAFDRRLCGDQLPEEAEASGPSAPRRRGHAG